MLSSKITADSVSTTDRHDLISCPKGTETSVELDSRIVTKKEKVSVTP